MGSSEGSSEIAPSRTVEKGLCQGETRKGRLISGEGVSRSSVGGKLGFVFQKGRAMSTKEGSEESPPRAVAPRKKAAGAAPQRASCVPHFAPPTSDVIGKH